MASFSTVADTPLLTLPREDLQILLGRISSRNPDVQHRVAALQARIVTVPMRSNPHFSTPPLTGREKVLARKLRDHQSFSTMAAELHVSLNTVKSQARTLYRKLDVTTRAEAIIVLERAGFYD